MVASIGTVCQSSAKMYCLRHRERKESIMSSGPSESGLEALKRLEAGSRPQLEALKRLEAGSRPQSDETMGKFCVCLPVFLVCCGFLASAVLFFDGCAWVATNWNMDWPNSEANHQGWYFIGLAFFVGPLLFGIAAIIHRLNKKKGE